tara:strand:+ start:1660 stop:2289 length:630 start_codon:yes stop_codon:yes gene_type:complete
MDIVAIEILGKENFKSKNAINSMKKSLKSLYNKLDLKDNFIAKVIENKENFMKYLKSDYKFTIEKKIDGYKINAIVDDLKKKEKRNIQTQNNKRKKLKNKLKGLREKRNNVFGKKINNLKKSHDNKILEKYIAAKRENLQLKPNKNGTVTLGGNTKIEIPDPDEINSDKDKWLNEFNSYKEVVDNMEKSSEYFKSTAYYKYISAIIDNY